ncbi:MAG: hypothetical protein IKA37_01585 [Spirochaetales bacterium]|nr:hypothetical protein [Spirochaetales bacterium]
MAIQLAVLNVIKELKKSGKIPSKFLVHIPKLKDCEDWGKAIFLGKINYSFKFSKLDGGLIELGGNLYYINAAQLQFIAKEWKWNTSKNIIVTEEE